MDVYARTTEGQVFIKGSLQEKRSGILWSFRYTEKGEDDFTVVTSGLRLYTIRRGREGEVGLLFVVLLTAL